MVKVITCKVCDATFEYSGKGRPSTMCSKKCKAQRKVHVDTERYYRKRDEILEQKKEYHRLNADRIREYDRRYHRENREKRSAYMRIYRERNYDQVIAREREYAERNRSVRIAAMRDRVRLYSARSDEEISQVIQEAYPEGMKACRFDHEASLQDFHQDRTRWDGLDTDCIHHAKSYRRLIADSGWDLDECFYCGETDESIHIDHVVALANGGLNDPRNLAPACAPCNQTKWKLPVAEWYERRFGVKFDPSWHPHGSWLSKSFPDFYPA